MAVLLVSGCPAVGKSTIAAALARRSPRGVHVVIDRFLEFVAAPVPPILPASHEQNRVFNTAAARACAAYAAGGYDVFADGVVGPWFLPVFAGELPAVEYVVLRADLAEVLARNRGRAGGVGDDVVRHMHAQLRELGAYERHALDTTGMRPDDAIAAIVTGRRAGRFALAPIGASGTARRSTET
jgi:chloramphenicol 3-O-phosphotransferase